MTPAEPGVTVTPACDDGSMPQQLVLIDPSGHDPLEVSEGGFCRDGRDDWRLDDQTRQIGLRGIAQARRALAQATRRTDQLTAA